MKTKFSFPAPGTIEATLEITMTIKEWEELSSQLNKAYPGWNLTPTIRTMVERTTKNFEGTVGGNHDLF